MVPARIQKKRGIVSGGGDVKSIEVPRLLAQGEREGASIPRKRASGGRLGQREHSAIDIPAREPERFQNRARA